MGRFVRCEMPIGRDHDQIEPRLTEWSGSRPPAEVYEVIFRIEIDVAGCRLWLNSRWSCSVLMPMSAHSATNKEDPREKRRAASGIQNQVKAREINVKAYI